MKQSTSNYGNSLATNVAIFLDKGGYIAYQHKEYCGMGFIFDKEKQVYVYGSVQDGVDFYPELVFEDRKSFVKWLSEQSDSSLKGDDNQRITEERLKNLPNIGEIDTKAVGVVWTYFKNL